MKAGLVYDSFAKYKEEIKGGGLILPKIYLFNILPF